MKAMHDLIHATPYELDETDRAILAKRTEEWQRHQDGARVGDYLITSTDVLRFTHDWGEDIQTTTPKFGGGSFYLSASGHMDYSGALDSAIPKSSLQLTDEIRNGGCWFFSHNRPCAHNGVDVAVPCRVYRLRD